MPQCASIVGNARITEYTIRGDTIQRVLVEIDGECASTRGNKNITEYADRRDTIESTWEN